MRNHVCFFLQRYQTARYCDLFHFLRALRCLNFLHFFSSNLLLSIFLRFSDDLAWTNLPRKSNQIENKRVHLVWLPDTVKWKGIWFKKWFKKWFIKFNEKIWVVLWRCLLVLWWLVWWYQTAAPPHCFGETVSTHYRPVDEFKDCCLYYWMLFRNRYPEFHSHPL